MEREHTWADERDDLLKQRNAHEKRLAVLKHQRAQWGRATPAHVHTDIAETEAAILDINNQIFPLEPPKYLDRMSAEERDKYQIALIMKLDMDMRDWRKDWRRDFGRLQRDFRRFAVVVLSLSLAASARPTVTWHVWVLVGLTVAILIGVAVEMFLSEGRK